MKGIIFHTIRDALTAAQAHIVAGFRRTGGTRTPENEGVIDSYMAGSRSELTAAPSAREVEQTMNALLDGEECSTCQAELDSRFNVAQEPGVPIKASETEPIFAPRVTGLDGSSIWREHPENDPVLVPMGTMNIHGAATVFKGSKSCCPEDVILTTVGAASVLPDWKVAQAEELARRAQDDLHKPVHPRDTVTVIGNSDIVDALAESAMADFQMPVYQAAFERQEAEALSRADALAAFAENAGEHVTFGCASCATEPQTTDELQTSGTYRAPADQLLADYVLQPRDAREAQIRAVYLHPDASRAVETQGPIEIAFRKAGYDYVDPPGVWQRVEDGIQITIADGLSINDIMWEIQISDTDGGPVRGEDGAISAAHAIERAKLMLEGLKRAQPGFADVVKMTRDYDAHRLGHPLRPGGYVGLERVAARNETPVPKGTEDGPEQEWRVRWEIDVTAPTALAAARQARDIQLDPNNIAFNYDVAVVEDGQVLGASWTPFDLERDPETAHPSAGRDKVAFRNVGDRHIFKSSEGALCRKLTEHYAEVINMSSPYEEETILRFRPGEFVEVW